MLSAHCFTERHLKKNDGIISFGDNLILPVSLYMDLKMILLGLFLGLESILIDVKASRPRANSFLFQKQKF